MGSLTTVFSFSAGRVRTLIYQKKMVSRVIEFIFRLGWNQTTREGKALYPINYFFFFKISIVPQILLTIPCTHVLYILWYTGALHIPVLSIAFSVLLFWYWILMWYLAIPLFIVCVYVHPRWFYLVGASPAIFIFTSCVNRWRYMFQYRPKKTLSGAWWPSARVRTGPLGPVRWTLAFWV